MLTLVSNAPGALQENELSAEEKQLLEAEVRQMVEKFEAGSEDAKIAVPDVDYALEVVTGCYSRFIKAAGGAVFNDKGKLLVIRRLGLWDLPKGKVDPGETVAQTAVREVIEETGLEHVELGEHLLNTYHTYELDGKPVLKESIWYRMSAIDAPLVPQTEESITEARWESLDDLHDIYADTYASIRLVFRTLFPHKFSE